MPHFTCVACKTRLSTPAAYADQVGDLCPVCGGPLEPVRNLAAVSGFHSIRPHSSAARSGASSSGHQRIAHRVAELMSGRDARAAEARSDAERLANGGGHPLGAASAR